MAITANVPNSNYYERRIRIRGNLHEKFTTPLFLVLAALNIHEEPQKAGLATCPNT